MSFPSIVNDPSYIADYKTLIGSGITDTFEIARRMGVSEATVRRIRHQVNGTTATPRPRQIGPACTARKHAHTPQGYREGCRCDETRKAWSAYSSDYTKRRREAGYQSKKPRDPATAAQEPIRRHKFVAANAARLPGVRRRVQALARWGHPSHLIAEQAGVSARHLAVICSPGNTVGVTRNIADAVISACEHVGRLPGFSLRAARRAAKAGHPPPEAWHGVDIDDPDAQPREYPMDHDAAVTQLAAMLSRWSRTIGHHCSFIAADGSTVSGVVSAVDLRQGGGGQVWILFREHPGAVHVVAFADRPPLPPGQQPALPDRPTKG